MGAAFARSRANPHKPSGRVGLCDCAGIGCRPESNSCRAAILGRLPARPTYRPHDIFGGEPPRLGKRLRRTDTQTGIQHRNVAGMLVGFLGEGVEPENSRENHHPYRGGTEGSNPSPSSRQSVSPVNPGAVSEKPRTLAAVCRATRYSRPAGWISPGEALDAMCR
jgi:hypothetical protein